MSKLIKEFIIDEDIKSFVYEKELNPTVGFLSPNDGTKTNKIYVYDDLFKQEYYLLMSGENAKYSGNYVYEVPYNKIGILKKMTIKTLLKKHFFRQDEYEEKILIYFDQKINGELCKNSVACFRRTDETEALADNIVSTVNKQYGSFKGKKEIKKEIKKETKGEVAFKERYGLKWSDFTDSTLYFDIIAIGTNVENEKQTFGLWRVYDTKKKTYDDLFAIRISGGQIVFNEFQNKEPDLKQICRFLFNKNDIEKVEFSYRDFYDSTMLQSEPDFFGAFLADMAFGPIGMLTYCAASNESITIKKYTRYEYARITFKNRIEGIKELIFFGDAKDETWKSQKEHFIYLANNN